VVGMGSVKLGDKISIFEPVTVIRIRKDALKRLNMFPRKLRNMILDEAVKTTLRTDHPYDVTLEDVIKAEIKVYSQLEVKKYP
jgi:hypothetical protein